jgi:hypothetical protein
MSVVGHWRRSMLGAGGVALLLPLGLVLGVALTTALGGTDTLRALGQVFAGPRAANAGAATDIEKTSKQVPEVPARKRRSTASSGTSAGAPSTTGGGSTTTSGGSTGGGGTQGGSGSGGSGSGGSGGSGNGSGGSSGGQTGGESPPPSEPPPSAVHETGQAAVDAVETVPVVGEPAGNAAQSVVDLIP